MTFIMNAYEDRTGLLFGAVFFEDQKEEARQHAKFMFGEHGWRHIGFWRITPKTQAVFASFHLRACFPGAERYVA